MFKRPGKKMTTAATFLYIAISPFLFSPLDDDDNEAVVAYNLKNLARIVQLDQVIRVEEEGGLGLFFDQDIHLKRRL